LVGVAAEAQAATATNRAAVSVCLVIRMGWVEVPNLRPKEAAAQQI
jgi:hypothetical protein